MLVLICVFVTMVTGAPQNGFRINKCCPQNKVLTPAYNCIDNNDFYAYTFNKTLSWLPPDVSVMTEDFETLPEYLQRHNLNLTYRIGVKAPCDGRQHLIFAEDVDLFALQEDGRLILFGEDNDDNMTFSSSSFCFDRLHIHNNISINVIIVCPCVNMTCIRKCCPSGRFLDKNQRCTLEVKNAKPNPALSNKKSSYFQLFGLPRCPSGGAYLLNPLLIKREHSLQYWFMDDGRVEVESFRVPIPVEEYCWDMTEDENGNHAQNLLYCKGWEAVNLKNKRRVLYGVMLLVDSVFLTVTLIIYGVLPELRTGLHAKHLMAHTASFLVAYLFLGIGQLFPDVMNNFCEIMAFTIQFAFLAAFFWLNVMCIDIAWAFSGLRPPQGSGLERDKKKFIFYSIYAWGMTGIISSITAIVEFVPGLADGSPLKPNFGHRTCWFEKPPAILAYFYGPMAFLLLANLILFLYTAGRIISVRRDTAILNRAGNTSGSAVHKDKQRLVLYVKLFCLMGLTWITEIISWAVGGADYYWYITDIVNMLRAVFIFVIFCCKRSVLNLLRDRIASFLPCAKTLTRGKSTSLSGPTSSLRLTSIKKSVRRPSQDT